MKLFLTLVLVFIAIVNVNADEEEIAIPTAGIHFKSLLALRDSLKNAKVHPSTYNADASTARMKLSSMLENRFDQKTLDIIASYAAAKANTILSKEDKISALKSVLSEKFNIEDILKNIQTNEPTQDRVAQRTNRMHKIMSKLPEKYQLPADYKFPENFEFSHRKSTK